MATIQIKVKPNARESKLERLDGGGYAASVKAAPVDDKANKELIGLVADHFGVAKAKVSIRSGGGGRMKLIDIE